MLVQHGLIPPFICAVDALPCRIAFERGKERHFWFLAVSVRTSGWLLLAEELPLKKQHGIIRVAAPLAGCDVSLFVKLNLRLFFVFPNCLRILPCVCIYTFGSLVLVHVKIF